MADKFTVHNMIEVLGPKVAKQLCSALARTSLGTHTPMYIPSSNRHGSHTTLKSVLVYDAGNCIRWFTYKKKKARSERLVRFAQETIDKIIKVKVTAKECYKGVDICENSQ